MIVPYAQPIPALLETPGVTQKITICRYAGAWVGDGLWQQTDEAEVITHQGIMYPSTADELQALLEGERTVKSLTLYWRFPFAMDDRLCYGGEEYRIVKVEPWMAYGYNKAIAQVIQLGRPQD